MSKLSALVIASIIAGAAAAVPAADAAAQSNNVNNNTRRYTTGGNTTQRTGRNTPANVAGAGAVRNTPNSVLMRNRNGGWTSVCQQRHSHTQACRDSMQHFQQLQTQQASQQRQAPYYPTPPRVQNGYGLTPPQANNGRRLRQQPGVQTGSPNADVDSFLRPYVPNTDLDAMFGPNRRSK